MLSTLNAYSPRESSKPKKIHILIVDDSVDELRLLMDMLRSQSYQISVAFNGQQGYQRALANRPDLILMDIQMPGVDGYAACRLIRANPQLAAIPLLFLSAANTLAERMQGFSVGAVDFISKPFAAEEVLVRVAVHLDLARRAYAGEHPAPVTMPQVTHPHEVLAQAALRVIRANLSQTPTLAELARQVGTHEKKLAKIFKEFLGCTVFTLIREERIRLAQRLLAETEMSVIDVAAQVGFQNACNFTTAFKERFNLTPSAFRRSSRDELCHEL